MSSLSVFFRNGDGTVQVDSMFADLSRTVMEKLSGNDKFKKHRNIVNAPSWSNEGNDVDRVRAFFEELLSGEIEPVVQSGGIYGVSEEFHQINSEHLMKELSEDPRYDSLSAKNRRRLMEFFRVVIGTPALRNRNPLHFHDCDSCIISNTVNVPKQIFNFPFGCYETDGLEALSLLLFAHSKKSKGNVVWSVSNTREEMEMVDALCDRLNLECIHVHDEIVTLFLEPERCACVVAFGTDSFDTGLSLAKSNSVPLHLHITDKQFRDIFIRHKTKIHLELPSHVRSISIEKGMLSSAYSLYRDADLRDLHMDVALAWQSLYLSPNEGGSANARPQLMDLCLWCLGWKGVREVAMSDWYDKDDRRYRPVALSRKVLQDGGSEFKRYSLKKLDTMSRQELIQIFVKMQTSFVGGRSRRGGLEALVTCGGTRSMNIAFETALGYTKTVSNPRVITGNPHLLVERAERRFGFEVVRIPDGGAMSLDRLREEITDERVVAVYVFSFFFF